MARQLTTVLTDDLDGSRADRTVEFGLDGVDYTIDLSETNAGRLRTALQPYLSAATPTGRGADPAPQPRRRGGSTLDQQHAIREWASRTGYELSGYGRMPISVVEVFHHAH